MKKTFINKIKKILMDQKEELELKTKRATDELDFEGDEVDELQGKLIASLNAQLSIRDKEKLFRINNALKKIEDKSFGKCEECGELIAEKRIEVNPHCSTCVDCAEELEMQRKRAMS
jgi:RNA polymerase-binding transcription factor